MAMLASRTQDPSSMGMASVQSSAARSYSTGLSSQRTPVLGSTQNGSFSSPTESEFSEAFDGPDSVKYVHWRAI